MKKYLLVMLAIVGLLFMTSCSEDDEDNSTLELSKKTVELSRDMGEESVTVITNEDKWNAVGIAEWVEVSRNGNKLVIRVDQNTDVVLRKTKVLVFAGGAKATIEIVQAGSEGVVMIFPEKVKIDQYGGKKIVDINANSKNWTASTDVDWITLDPKPYRFELGIVVKENTNKEQRIGKIIISVGDMNSEIEVTQSGILFYLTPFLEIGTDIGPIMDFELARRSVKVKSPDGLFNKEFWEFTLIKSPLFSKIRYSLPNEIYKGAIAFSSNKELFKAEVDGFKNYLIEQGWEKKNENTFYNPKYSVQALIAMPEDPTKPSFVLYSYVPKQDKDYPTFKEFPYGYLGWGTMKPEIDTYEEANGGTFNEDLSQVGVGSVDYLLYNTENKELAGRAYLLQKEGGLAETSKLYFDKNLVFFEDKGELFITKEFLELCEKEGFVYQGFNEWHLFINEKKSLGCTMRWFKYGEFDKSVIDFRLHSTIGHSSLEQMPNYFEYNMKDEEIQISGLREFSK